MNHIVRLSKEGRGIVSINIKPFNGNKLRPIEFKVDTGADSSTISKKTLEKDLDYPKQWIKSNIDETGGTVAKAGGKEELQAWGM